MRVTLMDRCPVDIRHQWKNFESVKAVQRVFNVPELHIEPGFRPFSVRLEFFCISQLRHIIYEVVSGGDQAILREELQYLISKRRHDAVYIILRLFEHCYCSTALEMNATKCTGFLRSFVTHDAHDESLDSQEHSSSIDKASAAFEHEECVGFDRVQSSATLLQHLKKYFRLYNDGKIFSSYVAVVGPSGIGKSFTIKQLANAQNVYVVYCSLAVSNGSAYPPRSEVANVMPNACSRDEAIMFWRVYLFAAEEYIAEAESQAFKPRDLLLLQYHPDYAEFQKSFADSVRAIYSSSISDGLTDGSHKKIRFSRDERRRICDSFLGFEHVKTNHESATGEQAPTDHTFAVVCMDEARGLLDEDRLHFRAFSKACTLAFEERRQMKSQGKFVQGENWMLFGVLLDTLSEVSDFFPQDSSDPSARRYKKDLAQPFYAIDTWCSRTTVDRAIAVNNEAKRMKVNDGYPYPDGLNNQYAKILRVGRPLWGALLDEGLDVDKVLQFALHKISPPDKEGGNSRSVAIFSYRMQVDIRSPTLAESLVASFMRYVLKLMPQRDIIETFQPGEPVLALASYE
ncbi:hypothetical protein V1514DRAFT_366863, partial [Lipomyces japonicus]|uniref:uncharacterized protein n=1 Tax=Lipomyces japonicus TaxID=56871 RepID=UPI0034CEE6C1